MAVFDLFVTGRVVFNDIREDYYILKASAGKHQPDSRVIFLTAGSASSVTVFLQRTAVTYRYFTV